MFKADIEKKTLQNKNYRKVLYTTKQMQLVIMHITDDIPIEVHASTTQFIRVESGSGYALVDGKKTKLSDGIAIVIPPGAKHRIVADKKNPLKLYTIYSPPEHKDGLIQKKQSD